MDSTIAVFPATFFAISAITVKVVTTLNFSFADEGDATTEKNSDRAKKDDPIFFIFHTTKEFIEVSNISQQPDENGLNFKVRILLV